MTPEEERARQYLSRVLTREPEGPVARRAMWREVERLAYAASVSVGELAPGVTITVPGDPAAALSPNLRLHWRERARRVEQWRGRARLAWLAAGSPVFRQPICIAVCVVRARVMDQDNVLASMKALQDSFVTCGLVPDDSAKWVTPGPLQQMTGRGNKGKEAVLFTITPIGNDPWKGQFS